MKSLRILLVLILLIPALTAPAGAADRLQVSVSVLPLWAFVTNVAGDRVEVSLLVPPGTDVHGFSLSPRDVQALHRSDLVILNGMGLEPFLDRLPGDVTVVDTSSALHLKEHNDPHVWLDPLFATRQVDAIAEALSKADPGNSQYYRSNAAAYRKKLQIAMDQALKSLAPLKGAYLITYHESFTHFARRFRLQAYSLTGSHAEQPLPRRMKDVYDIVKTKGVPAVFAEEQYPPDILERLTSDLGVQVCPLSTMVSGPMRAELYERAMEDNVQTILRCLGGER